jgi:hypothetical protein
MVVAGDHVLRAQIHQRRDRRTLQRQQIPRVFRRYAVRERRVRREDREGGDQADQPRAALRSI